MTAPEEALVTYEMLCRACEAYKGERHMVDRAAMMDALKAAFAVAPAVTVTEDARKSERDAVLEEAAQAFEKAAVEAGRQECCGHYRGGDRFDDPPECCGDPDFVISNATGAAAIRALKSTTPQTGSQE